MVLKIAGTEPLRILSQCQRGFPVLHSIDYDLADKSQLYLTTNYPYVEFPPVMKPSLRRIKSLTCNGFQSECTAPTGIRACIDLLSVVLPTGLVSYILTIRSQSDAMTNISVF
ncbi:hypothetical protein PAAG_02959 [Paracoccidioides lutzii Pb01]|uniref:Uncharacterized protein n=1 Tax=Paracoccidioides lutzii (strain ATCC MYA-826 / Pb01) TaxID=502779 RepID=C1GWR4_PARBA|nr:hypothetical protein PAAG_02959 [Paracoccidioides lutzii Pb01]EEH40983.2 hypothetical protein PAAG_02959 [Paracoccidioides lutzii Pb01]